MHGAGAVVVSVAVAAPPDRVWRALTAPSEVALWDGVEPVAVPEDYPRPGHHARWRLRLGPLALTLHDRVEVVEAGARLEARLDVGGVHVDERYQLVAGGTGTVVVSTNVVTCLVPGTGPLARRLVRANVRGSLARLARHCAAPAPTAGAAP